MLKSISWGSFLQTLAIILFFYYAVIIAILFRRKQPRRDAAGSRVTDAASQAPLFDLTAALKLLFKKAALQQYGRPELLAALREELRQVQAVQRDAVQEDINRYIQELSLESCGIQLDIADLSQVWP